MQQEPPEQTIVEPEPEMVPLAKLEAESPTIKKNKNLLVPYEESKRPATPSDGTKTPVDKKTVETGKSKSLTRSQSEKSSSHPEFQEVPERRGGLKRFFSSIYHKICARDNTANSTVSSENRHLS